MSKLIYGDRVGKEADVRVGASAMIFDGTREKILLTRRADNGQWCLPGGGMDPGESISETCVREVWEEIGLDVRVGRLIGVYSTPHRITEYPDGNRVQYVSFHFETEPIGGQLGTSDEVTEYGYFTPAEIKQMDLMEHHHQRIMDALAAQPSTFVR
ncbi:MAG: NUDIX domain-containing protein [Ardenticatenaceae bacterium]